MHAGRCGEKESWMGELREPICERRGCGLVSTARTCYSCKLKDHHSEVKWKSFAQAMLAKASLALVAKRLAKASPAAAAVEPIAQEEQDNNGTSMMCVYVFHPIKNQSINQLINEIICVYLFIDL